MSISLASSFDAVYVLNLKRRPDRLHRLTSHLAEVGVSSFEVVEAHDAHTSGLARELFERYLALPEAVKARRTSPSFNLVEMAICLSHREVYRRILQRRQHCALILEDDVFFRRDLTSRISQLGLLPRWDLLYLGATDYNFWANCVSSARFASPLRPYYIGRGMRGGHAYCLRLPIVEKMLTQIDDPETRIMPIDHLLMTMQESHTAVCLYPYWAIQDMRDSDARQARCPFEMARRLHWRLSDFDLPGLDL